MQVSVKLSPQWAQLAGLVNVGRFRGRYRSAMAQAVTTNAAIVLKEVRENIRYGTYSGGYTPNAPLTKFIKGFDAPLTDTMKKLPRAFSMKVVAFDHAEVGVQNKGDVQWISAIHDGARIRVTPTMRDMFMALFAASMGRIPPSSLHGRAAELWARRPGGWWPLAESTSRIVIPARPFFSDVVDNQRVQGIVARNFRMALGHAVAGLPVNYSTFEHDV